MSIVFPMLNPYFNPHTREGCDGSNHLYGAVGDDFNPHTREGCD